MSVDLNKSGVVGVHHEWDLEATFDGDEISVWLTDNINLGLACALLYLAAVFVGKKYMENQPRYNLRQPMMIWSLLLAVFSIIGSIRTTIVMYHVGQNEGFRGLICSQRIYVGPITRFWGPVFVFSKILEYMDTAFIILRKQKLIFLHWYHHLTVSLFSWWCYGSQFAVMEILCTVEFAFIVISRVLNKDDDQGKFYRDLQASGPCAGGGIFMTVNFIVHSLMYSYYAVRAAGFRVPRPVAVLITSSQIVQMVIGCIAIYCAHLWRNDGNCKTSFEHVLYGTIMYGSYFVLFVHFFYVTYVKKQAIRLKKDVEPSVLPEKQDDGTVIVDKNRNDIKSHYDLRERKSK